jgi:hypothetical protein
MLEVDCFSYTRASLTDLLTGRRWPQLAPHMQQVRGWRALLCGYLCSVLLVGALWQVPRAGPASCSWYVADCLLH